jgi:hypothetical protein
MMRSFPVLVILSADALYPEGALRSAVVTDSMLHDAAGVNGNHATLPYSRTPDYRCRRFPERITPFVRRSPAAFIVTSFVRIADQPAGGWGSNFYASRVMRPGG